MRESELTYLVCPSCEGDLTLAEATERDGERIMSGRLECSRCAAVYPVTRGIPRFVSSDNYAQNFGLEWTLHARTQYDSHSGMTISERRFFEETRWPRRLEGETILEVGSGSGRFTEQAARTGAFVVSMDYSAAVEVNYQAHGHLPNVLIVQGDVYRMPFRRGFFDRLFCFGMLQHTPDVHAAFMALPPMLRPGGELVVDVYKKSFAAVVLNTRYLVRIVTRRVPPYPLYRLTRLWIDAMWPLAMRIGSIPRIGPSINWRLLVADYRPLGLEGANLKEWAYLDAYDMLSPRYDSPQTAGTLRRWFKEAGMIEVEVGDGYNGVEGRGKRPPCVG
jgi:SAM-dependent methyltransferase